MSNPSKPKKNAMGLCLAIGVGVGSAFGAVIGVTFDALALSMSLGVSMGCSFGVIAGALLNLNNAQK